MAPLWPDYGHYSYPDLSDAIFVFQLDQQNEIEFEQIELEIVIHIYP